MPEAVDQVVGSEPMTGPERRALAQGRRAPDLQAALGELDPQLAEWADGFIFDEVWGRPGLGHRDRMLIAITALATTGKPNQLRGYLHGAIQSGIRSEELRDLLVMLVVYAGFPTAIEGLLLFEQVLKAEERHAATSASS